MSTEVVSFASWPAMERRRIAAGRTLRAIGPAGARAVATDTGDPLWEIKLPSSIEATPITYMGGDGRQFVAVVATGGSLTGSEVSNDEIIAFALPQK